MVDHEPEGAHTPPEPHHDPVPESPAHTPSGSNQVLDGMKQIGSGVGQIYGEHIAPTLSGGLKNFERHTAQIRASGQWQAWMPLVIPAAAVLGILGISLPVMRMKIFEEIETLFLFGEDVEQSGTLILVSYLIVLAAGIIGLLIPAKWARFTAALASMILGLGVAWTGLLLFVGGFSLNFGFGEFATVTPHLGTYVMLIVGCAMVFAGLFAILHIYKTEKTPSPAAPGIPTQPVPEAQSPTLEDSTVIITPEPSALPAVLEPLPDDAHASVLYDYAVNHPQYRTAVAAHPNAYPELLDWLAALGDSDINTVIAERTE